MDADANTGGVAFYDVMISAVDGGATPLRLTGTQRVILSGVNDNPPIFSDSVLKFVVAEDVATSYVVGTLGVEDHDNDTVTLTVTGSYATVFEGHASLSDVLTLAALDYETTKCYSVEVR